MKISYLLIPLLICCQSEKILSQVKFADLSGTVAEAGSGESMIGVNLLLYKDSLKTSSQIRGTTTNKFGFYSMPGISLGTYYLFVSSIGYETIMKVVELKEAHPTLRLNIELQKKIIPLGEVIVEGKRKTDFTQTTSTIEIEPDLIKQLPSLGGEADIFRAL